jgi:hypothetical protein
MTTIALPADLGDALMNKSLTSPTVPLLPDHLGPDVLDLGLGQEPGVVVHCTTKEPIAAVSPSTPCDSPFMRISASHVVCVSLHRLFVIALLIVSRWL